MTTLTRQDILALLIDWAAQHAAIEAVQDALEQTHGWTPESPLSRALWGTFDRYSIQLEARIRGVADDQRWLEYFVLECDMGANPHAVQIGVSTYVMDGIESLASMLADIAVEVRA